MGGGKAAQDKAQHATGRLRRAAGGVLLAAPGLMLALLHRQLQGWALYTEEEVLDANVLHPLFNSEEHFAPAYWRPSMRQRDRLSALSNATHAIASALKQLNVNAFLESGGLIGWLRHDEGNLPWESDGDVGILAQECRASGATKAALSNVIDQEYEVLKFACTCEEACDGDNKRMVGRIAHRGSGVCIDIFAYAPVRELRPWQKDPRYAGVEWWERVDDHADFTFPREALVPLQNGTFVGSTILLPQQPREFLSWEYGRCLGVHVWPWRLLLYTPVSMLVPTAVVAKGAVLLSGPRTSRSPWPAAGFAAQAAAALGVLRGGPALLALVATFLCELGAVALRPELCSPQARSRHRIVLLLSLAVLAFELRGSAGQLLCQLDDFHLRPRRPKAWTLCLFGKCWDF
mmetsp:Transcript_30381/g.87013  ORF Transcript_30381/g.87013 Transcript_30381/m.87013 type:complete len:404 (-) Transcript_30381:29-1240(-)